jgi:ketosteroid isomerase-like protein
MRSTTLGLCALALLSSGLRAQSSDSLARQVRESERAFAATMAARDLRAFGTFVSDEALFYGRTVLRGREAVVAAWARYFQGVAAPFSWEPETVDVLDSGTLAISSGPVRDPSGKIVGTFSSVWRRESDGRWRVLFDKGPSGGSEKETTSSQASPPFRGDHGVNCASGQN